MNRRLAALLPLAVLVSCAHVAPARTDLSRANVRGASLEYAAFGAGEPVLLIHGSIFADAFGPILRNAALSRYRVITYHRRGFAGSDRATAPFSISEQAGDALALLRHLGVDRAHVVGHSYGAVIALQLALDHPDAVASLALLESPIFLEAPSAPKLMAEAAEAAALHQKGDDRAAIRRLLEMLDAPRSAAAIDLGLGAGAFDTAVADAPTFFEVETPALLAWKLDWASLAQLRAPVLLMRGEETRPAFREAQDSLRRRLPEAEELIVADAEHPLQVVKPDPVARGLAGFFGRHPIR